MKTKDRNPPSSPKKIPANREVRCLWCEGPDLHAHLYDRTGRLLTLAPILTLWQANHTLAKSGERVTVAEQEYLLLAVKARLPMGSPHDPRNTAHRILAQGAHGDA